MNVEDTVKQIVNDLLSLGIRPGHPLLVHSSLRSVGKLPGGAETLVRGLLEALGPDGTLLMPALSYLSVTHEQPVFDVRSTPSCVGALTEYFRMRDRTLRSIHPTHSVCARGAEAEVLTADHINDSTPCGPHSPFHRLPQYQGQILMLGCGLQPNTSMHAIEESVGVHYVLREKIRYRVIDFTGKSRELWMHRHDFRTAKQRYDRVAEILMEPEMKIGRVLDAQCHLIGAQALWHRAKEKLLEDERFFVEAK